MPTNVVSRQLLAALTVIIASWCVPVASQAVVHGMAIFYEKYPDRAAKAYPAAQLHCLALNIYHEARGETEAGKFAVAAVTMNRVRSNKFPDDVCSVVWQRRQFSWTKDGRSDMPREIRAWKHALWIANIVMNFNPDSVVDDATYFHSTAANPRWAKVKRFVTRLGRHYFYAAN